MKHRLFIAIDLPDPIRAEIVGLQKRLDSLKLPVVWEKPQKLHLTLNFLGRVPDDQLNSVKKSISQVVHHSHSFDLKLAYLETLYKRHDHTLIYLSPVGDVKELVDLQKTLSQALRSLEIPQPIRFLPHFTIGRLKRTDPVTTKKYINLISVFEPPIFPEFTVDHLTLYESFLSRSGSTYQKLTTFMLQS